MQNFQPHENDRKNVTVYHWCIRGEVFMITKITKFMKKWKFPTFGCDFQDREFLTDTGGPSPPNPVHGRPGENNWCRGTNRYCRRGNLVNWSTLCVFLSYMCDACEPQYYLLMIVECLVYLVLDMVSSCSYQQPRCVIIWELEHCCEVQYIGSYFSCFTSLSKCDILSLMKNNKYAGCC